MPSSQALYYPWIDIRDESWLKTALLYWDGIQTIVPNSVDRPYSSETARILQDAQFLIPLRVHSRMPEIEALADDVLEYLATSEGAEFLIAPAATQNRRIHFDKLSERLARWERMHPDKLVRRDSPSNLKDLVIPRPRLWLAASR
jgi:hypothetical protein